MSKETVLKMLEAVRLPDGTPLTQSPIFSGLSVRGGHVGFVIDASLDEAYANDPGALAAVRQQAEDTLKGASGIEKVTAVLTGAPHASSARPKPITPPKPPKPAKQQENQIKHIIAVASGKGGVGKSTVAVNLAVALSRLGLAVGLLDADVYGPSVQQLLGLTGKPKGDGKSITPMTAHGIKAMTMGLLIDQSTPMIWRGPMVGSAILQLLNDVRWGTLDVLIVDMPPGTGDAQLTLAQRTPLAGAVIVSTPQDLALLDARKGIAMFEKVEVPILGIVENMSVFVCPSCGHESHIFSHGGAQKAADELGMAFLGALPLDMNIREASDAGEPVASQARGPHATAFLELAAKVMDCVKASDALPPPELIMED